MNKAPLLLRRQFSIFNRISHARIARLAARDGHESVTVQRVRIRRPFWSKSRLVGIVAVSAALYTFGRYAPIGIEVEVIEEPRQGRPSHNIDPDQSEGQEVTDEDEEQHQEGEEEDEEEEYDDALLFFPTGFSRPRERTFYRGSDPEWQEFKRLSQDRPRMQRIRGELVSLIRSLAAQNPSYAARLGPIDPTKGNVWVEFNFPDGPPLEYERPGIELTEELEWRRATRPVEELHHHRLNKILYPSEAAIALWHDTKRKVGVSWGEFRTYAGWGKGEREAQTVQGIVQGISIHPAPPSTSGSSPTPPPIPSLTSPTSAAPDTQSPTSSPPPGIPNPTINPPPTTPSPLLPSLPPTKALTLNLSNFRADLQRSQKPYRLQIPRGTFLVKSLIEIHGERARLTLFVTAAYDPGQGKYVGFSSSVFNVVEKRQGPKGGP